MNRAPNHDYDAPPPNGCLWCGAVRRGHYRRYLRALGWHTWTEPTDAQRLARLRARRAARLARRTV